jgi:hypothetical protein
MSSSAYRLAALLGASVALTAAAPALADDGHGHHELLPGNLLISRTVYATPSNLQAGVTQLPPGCATAPIGSCGTAVNDGTYPFSFNNDSVDAFFGITSPVFLDELTPDGHLLDSIPVPGDQFVTSFSSKSELALNLSPEGRYLSFVGYAAQPGMLDVSNANTPGVLDPGNGDVGPYYRVVAQLDKEGHFTFTETNAFSGDNGRAAITNDENGQDLLYAAGNAGQSKSPIAGVVEGAGAQFIGTPSTLPEADQHPGQPTPLGSFNITELGDPIDKASKDNNYRAIAIHNNVVYYTKGSGGNGVDTVYYVDTTGSCQNGVGLPSPNAQLPTSPPSFTVHNFGTATKPNLGIVPPNMCILKGFPTSLVTSTTPMYPFGMWFANDHTLYIADEGSGDNTYDSTTGQYVNATATAQPDAGLEKWVFDTATQQWNLAYTLQNGLDLGQPYAVPGYPTGNNALTGLPWAPATDGLRALTGRVEHGQVTIWAVTSTVSGSGDQGADPDRAVEITDDLDATSLPSWERFRTFVQPKNAVVLRGVSFTPGTGQCGFGGDGERGSGNPNCGGDQGDLRSSHGG